MVSKGFDLPEVVRYCCRTFIKGEMNVPHRNTASAVHS